jgi:hypothetical protein
MPLLMLRIIALWGAKVKSVNGEKEETQGREISRQRAQRNAKNMSDFYCLTMDINSD